VSQVPPGHPPGGLFVPKPNPGPIVVRSTVADLPVPSANVRRRVWAAGGIVTQLVTHPPLGDPVALRDHQHVGQGSPDETGHVVKDTGKLFAAPFALPEILGDLSDLLPCTLKVILVLLPVLAAAFTFHHGQQANDCLPSLVGLLRTLMNGPTCGDPGPTCLWAVASFRA
jgi:hypothetical protein